MCKRILSSVMLLAFLSVFLALPIAMAQSPAPSPAVASPSSNPGIAPAGSVVPDQDANSLIAQIVTLVSTGKLAAAIGGIVVLITYFFRKTFVDTGKIGSGSLPWVSLVLGAVFGIGSNLLLGASPLSAAEAILFSGPIASHLWSLIFKGLVQKVV